MVDELRTKAEGAPSRITVDGLAATLPVPGSAPAAADGFADTLLGSSPLVVPSPMADPETDETSATSHADTVDAAADSLGETIAEVAAPVTLAVGQSESSSTVPVVVRVQPTVGSGARDANRSVVLGAHLEVRHKLGAGGMGDVYAAREASLNREVAVKVLATRAASVPGARQRFRREAQVTAQLSHPNVVPVYTMESTDGGMPAMTMKLVKGVTFHEYVTKCREDQAAADFAPAYQRAKRIEHFLKICDAMAYSHSCGVIHRDIKPQNFMLGSFNEVYVMDWGMARVDGDDDGGATAADGGVAADGGGDDGGDTEPTRVILSHEGGVDMDQTQAGTVMGTPQYMSPEQAVGAWSEVGPAADQFSLGLVLYELLTLQRCRQAPSVVEMLAVAAKAPTLSYAGMSGPAVAPALRAVIDKATARRPDDRYATVGEFAEDLRRYQRLERVAAYRETLPQRAWRYIQRRPMLFLSIIAAILVAAAGATTFSLSQHLDSERAHARRQRALIRLVTKFTEHVHKADQVFSLNRASQEGLSRMVELRLRQARPGRITGVKVDAVESKKWLKAQYVKKYRQFVSIQTYSHFMAPGADQLAVQRDLQMLSGVEQAFRDVFIAVRDPSAASLSVSERRKVPLVDGVIHYAYAGLESGVVLDFPAHSVFPKAYDPRERPWYKRAVARGHSGWGAPYPDASGSGFLLPCSGPIYDTDGKLLGVVGVDMSNDTLLDLLDLPGVAGLREMLLIDSDGKIVTSSRDKGLQTAVSLRGNEAKGREHLNIPALAEQIRTGTVTGVVYHQGELFVYSTLSTLGFVVVARIDPEAHGLAQ